MRYGGSLAAWPVSRASACGLAVGKSVCLRISHVHLIDVPVGPRDRPTDVGSGCRDCGPGGCPRRCSEPLGAESSQVAFDGRDVALHGRAVGSQGLYIAFHRLAIAMYRLRLASDRGCGAAILIAARGRELLGREVGTCPLDVAREARHITAEVAGPPARILLEGGYVNPQGRLSRGPTT